MPEHLELRNILASQIEKKHFREFLKAKDNLHSLLDFYDDVDLRRGLDSAEREREYQVINRIYLNQNASTALPSNIRSQVFELQSNEAKVCICCLPETYSS